MTHAHFPRRLNGIITGKVTKPQFATPPRKQSSSRRAPSMARGQSPSLPYVKIKTEPMDTDKFAADPFTYNQHDNELILPSIERSPTAEAYDNSHIEALAQEAITSLRGGKLEPKRTPIHKSVARKSNDQSPAAARGVRIKRSELTREQKVKKAFKNATGWEIPPDVLREYRELKASHRDSATWTDAEKHLHKLLGLRGHHPLLPGTWKRDFTGINLEEILFAPTEVDTKVVIRGFAKGLNAQFRATKALTRIFALSSRVGDHLGYSDDGKAKAAKLIESEIRRYMDWADRDSGLARYEHPPNIAVYRVRESDGVGRALVNALDSHMFDWTMDYIEWHKDREIKQMPSTLFGLFVLEHVVLVLTQDIFRPESPARCLAELDLSRSHGQWLDHALSLAIPINIARTMRVYGIIGANGYEMKARRARDPETEGSEGDPRIEGSGGD